MRSTRLSTTKHGKSDIRGRERAHNMCRTGSMSTTASCVVLITLVATVASMIRLLMNLCKSVNRILRYLLFLIKRGETLKQVTLA